MAKIDHISYGGTNYEIVPAAGDLRDIVAPEFSDQSTYTAGQMVLKDGVLYRFTADHTGAWTGADAETVTVGGEIEEVKNEIKQVLLFDADASLWQQGTINASSGIYVNSTTRIRTTITLPKYTIGFQTETGYSALIYAFNGDEYVGNWNGTTFIKATTGNVWFTEAFFSEISENYTFKLVLQKDSSDSIVPSDASNCLFITATDVTFTKEGFPADAKKTGEAISSLQLDVSTIAQRQISINRFNIDDDLTKHYKLWQGGSLYDTGNSHYFVTQPIAVKNGDVVRRNVTTASDIQFGAYVKPDGTPQYPATISTKEGEWTATRDGYISVNFPSARLQNAIVTINAEIPETYIPYYNRLVLSDDVYLNEAQFNDLRSRGTVLNEKLIVYNGDSICESRINQGTSSNGGAYAKIIADTVGGTYENRAISGGILASAVPSGSNPSRFVVSDVANMSDNADLICFEGGYNDYARNVPLGEMTAESDLTGTLDTTTICGAVESIFRQAIVKWVGKPICFVIVHKVQNSYYTQNSAVVPYTFKDVHDSIVSICNKYAIPFYDACLESGLNGHNSTQSNAFLTSNSTGDADGTHPNEAGYRRYYVPQLIALFESIMPRLQEE